MNDDIEFKFNNPIPPEYGIILFNEKDYIFYSPGGTLIISHFNINDMMYSVQYSHLQQTFSLTITNISPDLKKKKVSYHKMKIGLEEEDFFQSSTVDEMPLTFKQYLNMSTVMFNIRDKIDEWS